MVHQRARRPFTVALTGLIASVLAVGGLASVGVVMAPAAHAAVAAPANYSVTIAARVCGEYTDIMANRARNNIQQSLRDLGKDSVYAQGQPISPTIEDNPANNPGCTPLDGWKFQYGSGGGGPIVNNLSTVSGAGRVTPVTGTVPLLDNDGNPTGSTIDGAVTTELTPQELALATNRNLWVQGGVATNPLLTNLPVNPGGQLHGFGALRCAIDNLNGDNVEWISYPTGVRHVFCYYYTVQPPPSAGTIIVRKQVSTPPGEGPTTFVYDGNISYEDSDNDGRGDFRLTVPSGGGTAEQKFVRAADPADVWDFEERAQANWTLDSLTCATGAGNANGTAVITGAKAEVTVKPGKTLICTYKNSRNLTGSLQLEKTSVGGVGTFDFSLDAPGTADDFTGRPVTTATPNTPVVVASTAAGLTGGYTATETLPADTPAGSWDLDQIVCNGTAVPSGDIVSVGRTRSYSGTIATGQQVLCTFVDRFTPAGSITLRKVTEGGVGTFGFAVESLTADDPDNPTFVGDQTAVVTEAGTPVTATGDPLDALPVDSYDGDTARYRVNEFTTEDTSRGSWEVVSVDCGAATPIVTRVAGAITNFLVELSPEAPSATCTVTNRFVPVATLDGAKVVNGTVSSRSGAVRIAVTCDDGTDESFSVAPGKNGTFALPLPLVFRAPTSCDVVETATGVASGSTVATKVAVEDRVAGTSTTENATRTTVQLTSGDDIRVVFTDTYATPAPPKPPNPGGGGGGSGGGGGGGSGTGGDGNGGTLPVTGGGSEGRTAGRVGLWVLVAGALMVAATRRRDIDEAG